MIDSTISDNECRTAAGSTTRTRAPRPGYDTTIENNSCDNSTAGLGCGIYNNAGATLTVSGGTITGNRPAEGSESVGAGVYNAGTATILGDNLRQQHVLRDRRLRQPRRRRLQLQREGTLYVRRATTVQNNSAGAGGGIFSSGTLSITNSAIADNPAASGGGISNGGRLTAVNTTIAYNNVSGGSGSGGGLDVTRRRPGHLDNTIVAQNTDGTGSGAPADDVAGTVSSSSANNLIGTGGSGGLIDLNSDNLVGVASPVGGATSYGGSTDTIALSANSPAIDGGLPVDPVTGQPLGFDSARGGVLVDVGRVCGHRGIPRPDGPAPTEVYVDGDWAARTPVMGSDGSFLHVGYDAFDTIQNAVDHVAAGGTVNVAAGTYDEQVTIDQSLTLLGAGPSLTTLQDLDQQRQRNHNSGCEHHGHDVGYHSRYHQPPRPAPASTPAAKASRPPASRSRASTSAYTSSPMRLRMSATARSTATRSARKSRKMEAAA